MIKLTVCLPLYKSKKIIWLALAGLINQNPTKFGWELIVLEENNQSKSDLVGYDFIKSYEKQLSGGGCEKISYIGLNSKMALNQKWIMCAQLSTKTSNVLVFQDHDCFSFPERLESSYDYIANKNNHWVDYNIGMYYDIPTGIYALYTTPTVGERTGLNIAVNTKIVAGLSVGISGISRMTTGLNYWLLANMKELVGKAFKRATFSGDWWRGGIDTNGYNVAMNKKHRQKSIINHSGVFNEFDGSVFVPIKILNRLNNMKLEIFNEK